ncbi:MAG: hypothetical protein LBK12_03030 [Odoribacteraceae bacterium]|jgi:hypothetical protein|nr:hypothetical protein [Odoribacteraceae bacterium]
MKRAFLLLLLAWAGTGAAAGAAPRDSTTWRVTITDGAGRPLLGVYVIHKRLARLLTTSDLDGECRLHAGALLPADTLLLQAIGYKTRADAWANLRDSSRVVMEELWFELPGVTVTSGARGSSRLAPGELLDIAAAKLKKLSRRTLPYCNYQGRARYEKITEYLHRALEYRREAGYFFTSGDVAPADEWDSRFCAYFVPAYSARSYNLTNNGVDTLSPVYMTAGETRFDAGTRKIFTLLRAVQLHGPLFAGTDAYEITAIETNRTEYIYAFATRPGAYPAKTKITCRGQLTIDYASRALTSVTFDYIDYQLYRQVLLGEHRKVASPFSTRATLALGQDEAGRAYIASCVQETLWKDNLGEDYVVVEQPSRRDPARGGLVEREAFSCTDYRAVPERLRDHKTRTKIHLVQRNPAGAYDEELFRRLPPLLEDGKAREDLARVAPLETQFRDNSNRSYYPDNLFKGFNGVERDDPAFRENLSRARQQLFVLFPEMLEK